MGGRWQDDKRQSSKLGCAERRTPLVHAAKGDNVKYHILRPGSRSSFPKCKVSKDVGGKTLEKVGPNLASGWAMNMS